MSFKLVMAISLSTLVIGGCANKTEKPPLSKTQKIIVYSGEALKECGKGNVKKVTYQGYECFKK